MLSRPQRHPQVLRDIAIPSLYLRLEAIIFKKLQNPKPQTKTKFFVVIIFVYVLL